VRLPLYIAQRLAVLVPTLFVVSVLIFSLQQLLPGDPAVALAGEEHDPVAVEAIRKKYSLDRPLPVQYALWMGKVLRGDLGESLRNKIPVTDLLASKLPVTVDANRRFTLRLTYGGRLPPQPLEPELIPLFDKSSCTLVHLSARRLLGNHELAKWLHAYLAAHPDGTCTVRAAKLRELCGSKAKTLFGFRRTLRHGLDILVEARLIEGYRIDPDRDLVSFGLVPPVRSSSRTVQPHPAAAAVSQGTALMAYATRPLGQLKLAQ